MCTFVTYVCDTIYSPPSHEPPEQYYLPTYQSPYLSNYLSPRSDVIHMLTLFICYHEHYARDRINQCHSLGHGSVI